MEKVKKSANLKNLQNYIDLMNVKNNVLTAWIGLKQEEREKIDICEFIRDAANDAVTKLGIDLDNLDTPYTDLEIELDHLYHILIGVYEV